MSCSSQVTLFRCISLCEYHGIFYLVPFRQPSSPTRFPHITAIGMCHFLPVHHFGMASLARLKVKIQQLPDVFHWRLSDSKSPQVSRTLLSILTVFNNAVVWMVSTRPPTSKSSSPFNNPLLTVPKAPITIGIVFTFMFHSFFNSLARSRYLSLFSHSISFILWSAGISKSTILQIFLFFFFVVVVVDYYKVWSSGRDLVIRLNIKVP